MATNIVMEPGQRLAVVCSDPATPASSDPVRYGVMTGIAETAEDAAGLTSVYFGPCVVQVSVKGTDGGNSAVAVGDTLFYVDANTPKISKTPTGYFFGFAMETVGSGLTATIKVLKPATPGGGTLTAGGVGATQLATGAVTAAKLSASLKTGFVHLPLTAFRLLATNDIAAKGTPDGGLISLDTDPTLKRANGATDKKLRIAWAAASVVEIVADFVYPPDLDDTAVVEVHLLAASGGATNSPVVAVSYFEGVGDTNAGGNTAAVTGTTVVEYTVTIAAADVGVAPQAASIGLVPAAHGTDALYLYGAWIEYTRA